MPYCSGCGSRYQEGDQVCKSCGFVLNAAGEPANVDKGNHPGKKNPKVHSKKKQQIAQEVQVVPKQPDNPGFVTEPEANLTAPPEANSGTRQLQSEAINLALGLNEIHLGKGIISPKAVERGVDGFHFKYEEQPQAVQNDELLINAPEESGLHVVKSEFAPELNPKVTSRFKVFNSRSQDHSQRVTVANHTCSIKNEFKPEVDADTGSVERSAPTGEELDALVLDSLEAELQDFEAALAEVRQAEIDLDLEMKAAEAMLQQEQTATDAETIDDQITAVETEATVPEESVMDGTVIDIDKNLTISEPLIEEPVEETDEKQQLENRPERQHGQLVLLQGRQSWYGIPLPYYYRLSDRLLVCIEPNGRSFEYEINTIKKITLKQSWLGKLLGIGDVEIDFINRVPARYVLTGIVNPVKLRVKLEELLRNEV